MVVGVVVSELLLYIAKFIGLEVRQSVIVQWISPLPVFLT